MNELASSLTNYQHIRSDSVFHVFGLEAQMNRSAIKMNYWNHDCIFCADEGCWICRPTTDTTLAAMESADDSGFWCERCQYWYQGDNQCPRHGR